MNKSQLISYLRNYFPNHIIKAFEYIKREDFIPKEYKKYAYEDTPIPIHETGATISQPYTIAFMLDKLELKPNSEQKTLEIGSGSGYVLALIEKITKGKTYGVEIIKHLADKSKKLLKDNKNIIIIHKSGIKGLSRHAPYDRILVSASIKDKKVLDVLVKQLKNNGIIVASVGYSVIKIKKQEIKGKIKIETREFPGFVFVPLVD